MSICSLHYHRRARSSFRIHFTRMARKLTLDDLETEIKALIVDKVTNALLPPRAVSQY